jgi:glutathione S-transferase
MLVRRQLERAPYMSGDRFTAADISVTYALDLGARHGVFRPGDADHAYLARAKDRDAYKRAFERSHEGVAPA